MSTPNPRSSRPRQYAARIGRWFVLMPLLTAVMLTGLVWLAGADQAVGQTVFLIQAPINIFSRQSIGQTFIAPADGLHRLDLMFVSYREIREGTVRLRIYNAAGDLLLRREFETSGFRDAWYSLEFPPQTGIAGQVIRFDLARDASWRTPIGIRVGPGSTYPDGHGMIRDEADPSFDLAFRAYLATPPTLPARWQRAVDLSKTVAWARPGPFGQPAFLGVLGAAYAAGLAALVCLILVAVRRR